MSARRHSPGCDGTCGKNGFSSNSTEYCQLARMGLGSREQLEDYAARLESQQAASRAPTLEEIERVQRAAFEATDWGDVPVAMLPTIKRVLGTTCANMIDAQRKLFERTPSEQDAEWERNEREADADIAAGRVEPFDYASEQVADDTARLEEAFVAGALWRNTKTTTGRCEPMIARYACEKRRKNGQLCETHQEGQMKITEKRLVPASEQEVQEVTVDTVCDICKQSLDKDKQNYEVRDQVVQLRYRVAVEGSWGTSYPEGGYGTTIKVDMCVQCFKEKLVPWLRSQGAPAEEVEYDW